MRPRRIFVAGSTGATGVAFMKAASAAGADVVPHVRPKSAAKAGLPGAAVFELDDRAALVAALRSCTTVVQLIGTVRKRFAAGDTYETSDVGTTRSLAEAAREAGVDHLILLSSVGAGKPMGAYLKAKAAAEQLFVDSGIPYTLFRPSIFKHVAPPGIGLLGPLLGKYKAIGSDELAVALLHAAQRREPLGVALEGRSLWDVVKVSGA
jgi:nucleoside-diphosphate-sugar epimerase